MAQPNPFLLAAEDAPSLLPLLRSNPSLAAGQDDTGYSLLHAAASYNHISLLRALVRDFNVNVNIRDEDGETPLFVVERPEIAECLVEELGADLNAKNDEGQIAEEKIEEEGDFPLVAAALRRMAGKPLASGETANTNGETAGVANGQPDPSLPANMAVNVSTVEEQPENSDDVVDPEFRRRIEELAARDDFHTEAGQAELRQLVTEAVRGVGSDTQDRDVRQRTA
ncbi:ankyrin repeat protein [Xylona heveae TC161]|uniref:Ankyrin repeat protein n=1 Tax=Xylona heveae (strain CBS 132557 / TC161) TaxID=1328760 RepID=A0A164Z909_XYLHT|nr:ankyrin repeat protein [Xylona heveae TC161]KZF18829.1 ankyrin repeat protein [Xylona heveae TC161]